MGCEKVDSQVTWPSFTRIRSTCALYPWRLPTSPLLGGRWPQFVWATNVHDKHMKHDSKHDLKSWNTWHGTGNSFLDLPHRNKSKRIHGMEWCCAVATEMAQKAGKNIQNKKQQPRSLLKHDKVYSIYYIEKTRFIRFYQLIPALFFQKENTFQSKNKPKKSGRGGRPCASRSHGPRLQSRPRPFLPLFSWTWTNVEFCWMMLDVLFLGLFVFPRNIIKNDGFGSFLDDLNNFGCKNAKVTPMPPMG